MTIHLVLCDNLTNVQDMSDGALWQWI